MATMPPRRQRIPSLVGIPSLLSPNEAKFRLDTLWRYRIDLKRRAIGAKYVETGIFDGDTEIAWLIKAMKPPISDAEVYSLLGAMLSEMKRAGDREFPCPLSVSLLNSPTGLRHFCRAMLPDLWRVQKGMEWHRNCRIRSIAMPGCPVGPMESPLLGFRPEWLVHEVWGFLGNVPGKARPEIPAKCDTAIEAISAIERVIAWCDRNNAKERKVRRRAGKKVDPERARSEKAVLDRWLRAKERGVCKRDFAEDEDMKLAACDRLIERVRRSELRKKNRSDK